MELERDLTLASSAAISPGGGAAGLAGHYGDRHARRLELAWLADGHHPVRVGHYQTPLIDHHHPLAVQPRDLVHHRLDTGPIVLLDVVAGQQRLHAAHPDVVGLRLVLLDLVAGGAADKDGRRSHGHHDDQQER
jgi:hypothetical protein